MRVSSLRPGSRPRASVELPGAVAEAEAEAEAGAEAEAAAEAVAGEQTEAAVEEAVEEQTETDHAAGFEAAVLSRVGGASAWTSREVTRGLPEGGFESLAYGRSAGAEGRPGVSSRASGRSQHSIAFEIHNSTIGSANAPRFEKRVRSHCS